MIGAELVLTIPTNLNSIISIVLALVDGLLFGVAIKKAITSVILAIVGLVIAGYIGINLPGINTALLMSKVPTIIAYVSKVAPQLLVGVPIFFIIGLAVGFWKG